MLYNNSKTICVILDNRITGMTGHQENPGSGKQASGKPAPEMDIATIVKALGAKHVMEVNPNDLKAVRKALDDALALEEASVIITKWPCVLKRWIRRSALPGATPLPPSIWSTRTFALAARPAFAADAPPFP